MNRDALPTCEFGPFHLDPAEHLLLRDGRVVPLTPKVFDVLCVLVREHGRLVSKERLLQEVWPDCFVEEANLNRSVSVLRKALGEHVGEQRYVETVPKLGYRFVAPIRMPSAEPGTVKMDAPLVSAPAVLAARPSRSIAKGVAAGSALVAAVALALLALRNPEDSPPALERLTAVHRQMTFTGREGLPTLSPDATQLAYVSSSPSGKTVMVQEVDGGPPVQVHSGSGAGMLRWSPDGRELLFWARSPGQEGVFVASHPGGTPRLIAGGRYVACWSPDGSTIAVASYIVGTIAFFDRQGRELRSVPLRGNHFWVWDMDWSEAAGLLLIVSSDDVGRFTVWTVRPDGRDQRVVLEDRAEIAVARWTPDGNAMFYSRRVNQTVSLLKHRLGRGSGSAGPGTSTLLSGLEMDRSFGLSADARSLAYARAPHHSNLWLVEAAVPGDDRSLRARELTSGTSLIERPRVSPDGRSIVFNVGSDSHAELYTMPITGGAATPLTAMESFSVGGVWSADGKRIAFASTRAGVARVWTVDADGGVPRALSTGEISDTLDLAWHPGRRILFQQPGNRNYYEIDPDSGAGGPLIRDASVGWVFSPVHAPDGRRIAVSWNRRAGRGLWIVEAGSRRETLVYESHAESTMPIGWTPDGSAVYAVEGKASTYRGLVLPRGETLTDARILLVPVNGAPVRSLGALPFDEVGGVSMTPDGRLFVCTVYSSRSDVWIVTGFDATADDDARN